MTDCTNTPVAAPRPAARPVLVRVLKGLVTARALYRQRRQLAEMDPHMLRDIGLTREQALSEADRPIWDAPKHWF